MKRVSPPLGAPSGFEGSFDTGQVLRAEYGPASGPVSLQPDAVAAPRHAADLAALIRWAGSEGIPLVSRGAGTGMPGGNVGRDISVDVGRHHQALDPVRPQERTVFAQAGVTLARVEEAALAHGLFFSLPSSAQRCTVGGVVANNAAGARSFGYGSVKEWVESVTVVLADGTESILRAGDPGPDRFRDLHASLLPGSDAILGEWPRVRKNSSGYGLDRFLRRGDALSLIVGSEGTLGIITGAVLRLAPLPSSRALALLAVPDLDHVSAVATRARDLGASACEFFGRRFIELVGTSDRLAIPADAEALVLIELEASEDHPREGLDDLTRLAEALSAPFTSATEDAARARLWSIRSGASPAIAEAAQAGLVSAQFIEDSVVPPEALPAYVRAVEEILEDAGFDGVIFGHAGDGNAHVNPLIPWTDSDWRHRVREALERTVDVVADLGGTLAGEHGDGRLRAPFLSRIWGEAAVDAFRLVKTVLDPERMLNPGVILPLPDQDPLEGLGAGWPRPGDWPS